MESNVAKLDIAENVNVQLVGTKLVLTVELDASKVNTTPSSTGKTMLVSKASGKAGKLGFNVLVYTK